MAIELHVLADARSLESFRLARGMHLLGSTENADLLLSSRDAKGDICRLELTGAGTVAVRSLSDPLRLPDGTRDTETILRNGQSVAIGRLQLLLHDRSPAASVQTAGPAPAIPETAPNEAVIHPARERLALRIRSGANVRVIEVDRPAMVFGRGPENTVSFTDLEVSRRHARLIEKPDGPWIEDLGSTHGTYLDGTRVDAAAWRLGSQVHLSREPDAPAIQLMTLADALAETGGDEAVAPLRGRSAAMRRVRAQVLRYGLADSSLLVLGETGTGKELVARALARLRGAELPFMAVNCGEGQESLIESQLFGYCRGAFTGAAQDRIGELEAAGAGTLLLDEIGDMPLAHQVKLLRVLEAKEVKRLGETRPRPFRARVVAGTHRDLGAMVAAGQFREDLFHRLAVLEIRLPPLRERLEDLPVLARAMLSGRDGNSAGKTLSDAAMDKLLEHRWPGNVRELKHVVERAALETDGPEIGPEDIEFKGAASTGAGATGDVTGATGAGAGATGAGAGATGGGDGSAGARAGTTGAGAGTTGGGDGSAGAGAGATGAGAGAIGTARLRTIENLPAHLDGIREDWCRRALAEAHGNVRAAARTLAISRTTLQGYLTRFRIAFDPGDSGADA